MRIVGLVLMGVAIGAAGWSAELVTRDAAGRYAAIPPPVPESLRNTTDAD